MLVNEKSTDPVRRSHVPLSARPLDMVYFAFFAVHLVVALFLDIQPLYPPALVPGFMSDAHKAYVNDTADPLLMAFMGLLGPEAKIGISWFETFLYCEAFIQVPVFIISLQALWYNRRSLYIILALYGVHSATTIAACLTHLYRTPTCGARAHAGVCLSPAQSLALLGSYGIFFTITLTMAVELGYRCTKWMKKGLAAQKFE